MSTLPKAAEVLVEFQPAHGFFVGIDSDGSAFDAMEIKHQECFTPSTIKCWDLQPVARVARETALLVNLCSSYRGLNRWIALVKVFELLAEREEVKRRGSNFRPASGSSSSSPRASSRSATRACARTRASIPIRSSTGRCPGRAATDRAASGTWT